ncbi:MAG TPA: DJ-1/PfpI family protein [Acidimicrobiales bacterium]|jgi:transcriptional regulator GlxA family with amidase domain
MPTRSVVIVTFEGIQPIDAVGPHEVFHGATRTLRAEGRSGGYDLVLASVGGGPVRTESGLELGSQPLPEGSDRIDTLILPGGSGSRKAAADPQLMEWVRRAARRSRRVATVCSGTFLAAEAGLIDHKRVTTHWARAAELAEAYPAVVVDPDPIYRRDGKVWSSAGVTAGIDLALALVEEDYGVAVAQTVARWLVMFLHRPGGQTQFAAPVWVPRAERSAVRSVQTLIESAPEADHRLPVLAAAATMSVRHFARVFTDEVGETPTRFVERVRLEAARHQLETTSDTLDRVALRTGLGTAETLRRVFQRRLGVSPDAYRHRFATATLDERTSA